METGGNGCTVGAVATTVVPVFELDRDWTGGFPPAGFSLCPSCVFILLCAAFVLFGGLASGVGRLLCCRVSAMHWQSRGSSRMDTSEAISLQSAVVLTSLSELGLVGESSTHVASVRLYPHRLPLARLTATN